MDEAQLKSRESKRDRESAASNSFEESNVKKFKHVKPVRSQTLTPAQMLVNQISNSSEKSTLLQDMMSNCITKWTAISIPDPNYWMAMIYIAKFQSSLFDTEKVVCFLINFLKSAATEECAGVKRPSGVYFFASSFLHYFLKKVKSWPVELVQILLEDSLGSRLWVDQELNQDFCCSILTALPKDNATRAYLLKENLVPITNCHSLNRFPVENAREQIFGYVVQLIQYYLSQQQQVASLKVSNTDESKKIIKVMMYITSHADLRALISSQLESWLNNSTTKLLAHDLFKRMVVNFSDCRSDLEIAAVLIVYFKAHLENFLEDLKKLIRANLLFSRFALLDFFRSDLLAKLPEVWNSFVAPYRKVIAAYLHEIWVSLPSESREEYLVSVIFELLKDLNRLTEWDLLSKVRTFLRSLANEPVESNVKISRVCELLLSRLDLFVDAPDVETRLRNACVIAKLITAVQVLNIPLYFYDTVTPQGVLLSALSNEELLAERVKISNFFSEMHFKTLNWFAAVYKQVEEASLKSDYAVKAVAASSTESSESAEKVTDASVTQPADTKPEREEGSNTVDHNDAFVFMLRHLLFLDPPTEYAVIKLPSERFIAAISSFVNSFVTQVDNLVLLARYNFVERSEMLKILIKFVSKRAEFMNGYIDRQLVVVQDENSVFNIIELSKFKIPTETIQNGSSTFSWKHFENSVFDAKCFWQACNFLVICAALSPCKLGKFLWNNVPTMQLLLEMALIQTWKWPPFGDERLIEASNNVESEECRLLSHLELCMQETLDLHPEWKSTTEFQAGDIKKTAIYIQLASSVRKPPDKVIDKLKNLDKTCRFFFSLACCRNPDFVMEIMKKQRAVNRIQKWLNPIVKADPCTIYIFPTRCLAHLLYCTQSSNAEKREKAPMSQLDKILALMRYKLTDNERMESLSLFLFKMGSPKNSTRLVAKKCLILLLSDEKLYASMKQCNDASSTYTSVPLIYYDYDWIGRMKLLPFYVKVSHQLLEGLIRALEYEHDVSTLCRYYCVIFEICFNNGDLEDAYKTNVLLRVMYRWHELAETGSAVWRELCEQPGVMNMFLKTYRKFLLKSTGTAASDESVKTLPCVLVRHSFSSADRLWSQHFFKNIVLLCALPWNSPNVPWSEERDNAHHVFCSAFGYDILSFKFQAEETLRALEAGQSVEELLEHLRKNYKDIYLKVLDNDNNRRDFEQMFNLLSDHQLRLLAKDGTELLSLVSIGRLEFLDLLLLLDSIDISFECVLLVVLHLHVILMKDNSYMLETCALKFEGYLDWDNLALNLERVYATKTPLRFTRLEKIIAHGLSSMNVQLDHAKPLRMDNYSSDTINFDQTKFDSQPINNQQPLPKASSERLHNDFSLWEVDGKKLFDEAELSLLAYTTFNKNSNKSREHRLYLLDIMINDIPREHGLNAIKYIFHPNNLLSTIECSLCLDYIEEYFGCNRKRLFDETICSQRESLSFKLNLFSVYKILDMILYEFLSEEADYLSCNDVLKKRVIFFNECLKREEKLFEAAINRLTAYITDESKELEKSVMTLELESFSDLIGNKIQASSLLIGQEIRKVTYNEACNAFLEHIYKLNPTLVGALAPNVSKFIALSTEPSMLDLKVYRLIQNMMRSEFAEIAYIQLRKTIILHTGLVVKFVMLFHDVLLSNLNSEEAAADNVNLWFYILNILYAVLNRMLQGGTLGESWIEQMLDIYCKYFLELQSTVNNDQMTRLSNLLAVFIIEYTQKVGRHWIVANRSLVEKMSKLNLLSAQLLKAIHNAVFSQEPNYLPQVPSFMDAHHLDSIKQELELFCENFESANKEALEMVHKHLTDLMALMSSNEHIEFILSRLIDTIHPLMSLSPISLILLDNFQVSFYVSNTINQIRKLAFKLVALQLHWCGDYAGMLCEIYIERCLKNSYEDIKNDALEHINSFFFHCPSETVQVKMAVVLFSMGKSNVNCLKQLLLNLMF